MRFTPQQNKRNKLKGAKFLRSALKLFGLRFLFAILPMSGSVRLKEEVLPAKAAKK